MSPYYFAYLVPIVADLTDNELPRRHPMPEKRDPLNEELDQLSEKEIEARIAAAIWVDEKRAAVLRYLEEKKLGRKREAQ